MGKAYQARQRLGDLLLEYEIINAEQLEAALERQQETGGTIGSALVEMGFLNTETLLEFLEKQLGVPGIHLQKLEIDAGVHTLLPEEKIRQYNVLPIAVEGNSVTLAMVNPLDYEALSEIQFLLGKRVKPVVVSSHAFEETRRKLHPEADHGEPPAEEATEISVPEEELEAPPELSVLLREMVRTSASDMMITAGVAPSMKITSSEPP